MEEERSVADTLENKDDVDTGGVAPESSKMNSPHNVKKVIIRAVSGLVILTLIFVVVAAATGRMAATFKQPNERMIVRSDVCGDAVVAKYNAAIDGADVTGSVPAAVTDLVNEFSKSPDYQSDPTCLYIEFSARIQEKDYDKAKGLYDKIVKLTDQGVYVSTKIYNMAGLTSMGNNLNSIKASTYSSSDFDAVDFGND